VSGSRLLVTGGGGFLGRRVVEEFRSAGAEEVFVPRSGEYDLRTGDGIDRALEGARPDVVVHLAALVGGIGFNQSHPGRLFYDNAVMGIELMERARRSGVSKFVTVGTVCSYPKLTPIPFREEQLWEGYPEETNAPYGLAKKMLLAQSHAYRLEYGFNAIFLIPTNLYGPGDNFHPETSHVIPALIRRFLEAKEALTPRVTCWGTGSPTREFIYVEDAARAVRLATQEYDRPEPLNLGSGEEVSIRTLAQMIASIVEYEGEVVWDSSRPDGQPRRRLDTSRAERELGFRAEVPLAEGVRRTVTWYREHRFDENPRPQPVLSS
jgi:GDP-L-fucose synthase